MAENNINFGEQFETNLIAPGDYEVIIDKVEPKISKNEKKTKYLNFTFKIRNDVDQNFKNRNLFYIVSQKDGDVCYDFNKINKIIITQKETPNYKTNFNEIDEVLLYLVGLHLKLTVITEFDEFKGEDRNKVKDFSFKPSEWDKVPHENASTEPKVNLVDPNSPDVEDNDLPF